MAKKLGRLAGLAALAGAAYMMSKGKDKEGPSATAEEKEASDARAKAQKDAVSGNKTVEKSSSAYNPVASSNTQGQAARNRGVGDATNDPLPKPKPAPKPKDEPPKPRTVVSEPSDKSVKLAPERRNLEANMSRGTRAPAKPASTTSSSEEGMKNYKPRRTTTAPASTVSSSAEGMKNYKPRSTPAAPAFTTTKVAGTPPAKSRNMLEEAKEEARRRAAASQATRTSTSSSNSPVTRTPFPGSSALNKKHGGAVKMASGGMAASRRGDGIAQRGKTRGKMC